MHVAIHISERAGDARVQRIAQVEEKGAAGVVIVGEEDAARGHDVFGVVYELGLLIGIERGQQLPVVRRGRRRVDDSEEVGLLSGSAAGPDEEVVRGVCRMVRSWRGERGSGKAGCKKENESAAKHAFPSRRAGERGIWN